MNVTIIIYAIAAFLVVTLLLVALLLFAKAKLTSSGAVKIDINEGGKVLEVESGATLLTLVYNERQREFVGEGKRWYDLVRQAEYDNSTANVLTSHMAATTIVKNRLKQLYSMYNPIYSEEMKIAGVENGGALVQNPVWERYTK